MVKSPRKISVDIFYWLTGFIIFTIAIPLLLIFILPSTKRAGGFATISSTPFIEYLAVSVGIGFGINPIVAFLLTFFPCLGYCLLMMAIFEFIGDSSEKVKRFLEKTHARIEKYPRLKKYGVASNFIFVMIFGVYICPGISFILGWPKWRAIVFMAAGNGFITLLIGLGTIGIIELFFM